MEAMRESWTDARLDDFAGHVDKRFGTLEQRVDNGFNRVDADVRALREEMNKRFDHMDTKFEAVQREIANRFERLHRLMIQVGGGVVAALARRRSSSSEPLRVAARACASSVNSPRVPVGFVQSEKACASVDLRLTYEFGKCSVGSARRSDVKPAAGKGYVAHKTPA